jgi:hypothetical protein
MKKWNSSAILILVFFVLLFANPFCAYAGWSSNPTVNTPISTPDSNQTNSKAVSDGKGGAILSWADERAGSGISQMYAQRIDANGNVLWTTNGVPLSSAVTIQGFQQMVSDGNGGTVVAWQDYRNGGGWDIYAQRIDGDGNVLWTTDGVAITTAASGQSDLQIVSDGSGGAVIVWGDYRNNNWDIYAQRIDADGSARWTATGVAIAATPANQVNPQLVGDGSGGAIIVWHDSRNGTNDIYAQRIDADGNFSWTTNGVAVCTAAYSQAYPQIVSDGSGGVVIVWEDNRATFNYDIYAQRINANGAPLWTPNGVAVAIGTNTQRSPQVMSDGSGGGIFVWEDNHSGTWEVYAQRMNANGSPLWPASMFVASTSNTNSSFPAVYKGMHDGSGGVVIAWQDQRNAESDIYAQRINANGVLQWTAGGVAISTASYTQEYPTLVGTADGVIITWDDWRNPPYADIYAQKVRYDGIFAVTCSNDPVMIGGTSYKTIQDAYDKAQTGDVVMMQASAFSEALNIDKDITIDLKGGYQCDYSTNSWFTSLCGTLTIGRGTVTIENVIVQ